MPVHAGGVGDYWFGASVWAGFDLEVVVGS